jgi:hypothetical protein
MKMMTTIAAKGAEDEVLVALTDTFRANRSVERQS